MGRWCGCLLHIGRVISVERHCHDDGDGRAPLGVASSSGRLQALSVNHYGVALVATVTIPRPTVPVKANRCRSSARKASGPAELARYCFR